MKQCWQTHVAEQDKRVLAVDNVLKLITDKYYWLKALYRSCDKCAGCGQLYWKSVLKMLQSLPAWMKNDILNYKIAEYNKAVVQDRPCFHISLVIGMYHLIVIVSRKNDIAIVPDVGMFTIWTLRCFRYGLCWMLLINSLLLQIVC